MKKKKPWYKDGIPFKCQQCGRCCTGAPGYVWLKEEDEERIIELLKISKAHFRNQYTRTVNGALSLKEMHGSYDCIFFKDRKCMIYQARPIQCRTFPFWRSNLESEASLIDATMNCPGVQVDSPIISLEEIEKRSKQNLF